MYDFLKKYGRASSAALPAHTRKVKQAFGEPGAEEPISPVNPEFEYMLRGSAQLNLATRVRLVPRSCLRRPPQALLA